MNSTFHGMRLRTVFLTIDARVRFTMPDKSTLTAGDIAKLRKIPGDFDAPIYTAYEDPDGYVYIGIAASAGIANASEWADEQMKTPLFRSIDRVDLLGQLWED